MAQEIITLENLAAEVAKLRGELATWKALAIKQDRLNAAQMLAVNSGATAGKIAQIATNTSDIAALQQIASSTFRVVKVAQLPASGEPYIMYLVPQTDGETLNYCNEYLWIDNAWELVGTTGAMANNGELQIIVNGVTVGTFTANQATNSTASITVPTDTSQLTNGAGYVDATALATALASKQDSLSITQLAAVNSGITSADVAQIGANTTAIAGKQDALTTSQLAAVNSGITSADVTQIGTNTGNIATNSAAIISLQGSKQNALSAAQLLAVNSGITSSLVTQIGTNQSDISTLNTALGQSLTPSADNTYSLGGASFRYASVYAVTFTGDLTGTASKAIADEDGNSIKSSYGKLAGANTWTNVNAFLSGAYGSLITLANSDLDLSNGNTGISLNQHMILVTDSSKTKSYAKWQSWTNDSESITLLTASYYPSSSTSLDFSVLVKASPTETALIPYGVTSPQLGTSTNQWASVYAQTYYYNGTAWGLDKANVWTGNNSFRNITPETAFSYSLGSSSKAWYVVYTSDTHLVSSTFIYGVVPSQSITKNVYLTNGTQYPEKMGFNVSSTGTTYIDFNVQNKFTNGALDPNGTIKSTGLQLGLRANGDRFIYTDAAWRNSLTPYIETGSASSDSGLNLGTSTNKWKTINGVNPGALSLPSQVGYVTIDTTNWDLTGNMSNPNYYTPTVDGWLCIIALTGTMTDAWLDIWENSLWGQSVSQSPTGELFCMIPVRANLNVRIRIKASSIYDARLFVASGNV